MATKFLRRLRLAALVLAGRRPAGMRFDKVDEQIGWRSAAHGAACIVEVLFPELDPYSRASGELYDRILDPCFKIVTDYVRCSVEEEREVVRILAVNEAYRARYASLAPEPKPDIPF